jgi:hypothetical protein
VPRLREPLALRTFQDAAAKLTLVAFAVVRVWIPDSRWAASASTSRVSMP